MSITADAVKQRLEQELDAGDVVGEMQRVQCVQLLPRTHHTC